jgi:hypothetical protein
MCVDVRVCGDAAEAEFEPSILNNKGINLFRLLVEGTGMLFWLRDGPVSLVKERVGLRVRSLKR